MAITFVRKAKVIAVPAPSSSTPEAGADAALLAEVGITEGYKPHPALPALLHPHFTPGQRVTVTCPGAAKYHCQAGDQGTIAKVIPAGGRHDKQPDDDCYAVDLVQPRTEKTRVYLHYKELCAS